MKELLSMLMALFISMFENVDYQHYPAEDFKHDSYYVIEQQGEVDYRDLYGQDMVTNPLASCVPGNRAIAGCMHISDVPNTVYLSPYWFVPQTSIKHEDIPDDATYTFTADSLIVSPYNGTLDSYSVGNDGKTMLVKYTIQGESVTLYFENLERWWCCMGKIEPDGDSEGTWKHTCDELRGAKFEAGHLIGRAIANETTVTVSGADSTLKEFFSH